MSQHTKSMRSLCPCCIAKEMDSIVDHLDEDINIVNGNIYLLDFSKNNNKKDELTCPICLDKIHHKTPIHKTECGHKFHAHCFILHCLTSTECPMCREEILEDDEDNDELDCLYSHIHKVSMMAYKALKEDE